MKRSLRVMDGAEAPLASTARSLRAGDQRIEVFDTGDGSAAERFAALAIDGGAKSVDSSADEAAGDPVRIVIRATGATPAQGEAARVLEASADVILGSVRPAFAARLNRLRARRQ